MTNTVVFDFDGTIVDTIYTVVNTIFEKSGNYNYKRFQKKKIKELLNQGSAKVIESLGINKENLTPLMKDIRDDLIRKINKANSFKGIVPVIKKIKSNGNSVGIITSNYKESVLNFFAKNDFKPDFIYDQADLSGKTKVIAQMLKERNLTEGNVYYIGDEDRDILAANKNNIKSVAVTWGYNSETTLSSVNPSYIVKNPQDLLNMF